jgi:septal ring-binding cell division protein DamX
VEHREAIGSEAAPKPPAAPAEPAAQEKIASQLNKDQVRRMAAYSTGGQPLLTERVGAARSLLDRLPDERYAIELFVTDNPEPARMERFLLRARDLKALGEIYVLPLAATGRYRLRVVYGAYASREDALAAEKNLPQRYLDAFQPAPRSFGELRRAL